jgi:L-serine dehydratase
MDFKRTKSRPRGATAEPLVFIGAFDLFRIGIGPSSSHTVGPMRAAADFVERAARLGALGSEHRIVCDLYGSLALTGVGHGTDGAVIAGLNGEAPESVDPDRVPTLVRAAAETGRIVAGRAASVAFAPLADLRFRFGQFLPGHPNALTFSLLRDRASVLSQTYFSIGGGFVEAEGEDAGRSTEGVAAVPYPYRTTDELLALCAAGGVTIAQAAHANECVFRSPAGIEAIWSAMRDCCASCNA